MERDSPVEWAGFSTVIPAISIQHKLCKIWLTSTWKILRLVYRDLGNHRPGSRQTGLEISHIIAQPGWPGLALTSRRTPF